MLLFVIGCGGGGDAVDAGPDADVGPGAADVDFVAGAPLPSGEWLIANDWAPIPNVAFALPAGELDAARLELFSVNRVWSMGAADDGSAIYFSAWDEQQEAHFGVTIGDAIQNSFVYETASQQMHALSWGNINDECQTESDGYLYVCRRYDFDAEGAYLGWRLARIPLTGGAVEFLRADVPGGPFELSPQPIGDGTVLFDLRARFPQTGGDLVRLDLDSDEETVVRANASRPLLARDGHRYLFQDQTDGYIYKMGDLAGEPTPAPVVTATDGAGAAAWSPDGDTVVYAVFDDTMSCDHLEQVTWDGDAWSAPVRVRDCTTTGEFITDLAWVVVP